MAFKVLVAGNWKMHGQRESVKSLLQDIAGASSEWADLEWVVFPSYVYLPLAEKVLAATSIAWGGQNISTDLQGALTGEVSAPMLKEYGCQWVILGHSERRHLLGEQNDTIAKKCHLALSCGLKPIFCVGETEHERESGATEAVIMQQLDALLSTTNDKTLLAGLTVAYEPVWAIGTGQTATPAQAEQVHVLIRKLLADCHPSLAQQVRILYGGSVKPENAKALIAMKSIDGFLVGGASLQASSFYEIGSVCIKYS